MVDFSQYPFEIRPLSEEEGGGFLMTFPDFSQCISDGETIDETIRNGLEALHDTIAALELTGHPVPEPDRSDPFIQLPNSLYTRMVKYAKQEKVNLNTLITTLIAESLEKRVTRKPYMFD